MDIEFDYRALGHRINQCRKEAKLSQEMLAERVEISQQHMSNIINNKSHPGMTTLLRIAIALDADLNYLMGAETTAGHRATDAEIDKLFSSMSVSDKQMCIALCRTYLEHKSPSSKKGPKST